MFNGTYTMISTTGEHRTFKIHTQPKGATFAPGARIVSILKGTDNNDDSNDWLSFGFVSPTGQVRVWKSRRGTEANPSFFDKCAAILTSYGEFGEKSRFVKFGIRIALEKRCIRCNRKLTNPTSLETGIGPECAQKA